MIVDTGSLQSDNKISVFNVIQLAKHALEVQTMIV